MFHTSFFNWFFFLTLFVLQPVIVTQLTHPMLCRLQSAVPWLLLLLLYLSHTWWAEEEVNSEAISACEMLLGRQFDCEYEIYGIV